MRRIAAIGMFDGLHSGHRFLLGFLKQEAAARRLFPSVVTFERHPLEHIAPDRAPRLLMSPGEKIAAIRSEGIDSVILLHFDERMRRMSAPEFMEMLHRDYDVDCLVVGYDHRFGRDRSQGFDDYVDIGAEIGMEVVRAPEKEGASSSAVRRLLADGDVGAAAAILGRPYTIRGVVVTGKQLGRTIGFPTANLSVGDSRRLIPAAGVYAADVTIDCDSTPRRAMLNIGHRPTVDSPEAPLSVEVHVIGYSGDLYGHSMSVAFLRRLRDEVRFPSIELLKRQLQDDSRAALECDPAVI